MNDLRRGLPEIPRNIARLRRHRGYPVPWFVADIDGEPDFRILKPNAIEEAWRWGWCWVCGRPTGTTVAFVIGPMCAVNRNSAEPPSHRECAVFSALACPFLTRPHMERREAGKPEGTVEPAGIMLRRNPGVALVWVVRKKNIKYRYGLFNVGEPQETLWFAEGREATRAEIEASIESGLPMLREMAEAEGDGAVEQLKKQVAEAETLLPV